VGQERWLEAWSPHAAKVCVPERPHVRARMRRLSPLTQGNRDLVRNELASFSQPEWSLPLARWESSGADGRGSRSGGERSKEIKHKQKLSVLHPGTVSKTAGVDEIAWREILISSPYLTFTTLQRQNRLFNALRSVQPDCLVRVDIKFNA
jgi:hypothetical protein